MNTISARAKTLAKNKLFGVLSTISHSVPGYPFGSLAQYCFDNNGNLIMYLSHLAEHTENICHNKKVSVTIVDDNPEDIQSSARLTIIGDAEEYADDDIADIYSQFFPESIGYRKVHGFKYYRIKIIKVRYIGGFGDIHWINAEDFSIVQPFNFEEIRAVADHMNSDHVQAMKRYLNKADIDKIKMLHFDKEGMWLKTKNQTNYIPFLEEVTNTNQLHKVLTNMAKQ